VIRPALERGETVLCDRYGDSTLAYQGYGHFQPLAPLRQLIDYATRGLAPDITIYLDLDVRNGLARKREGLAGEWNRIEEKALAYHQAVRQGYLEMASQSSRWLVVDADQTIEAIHAQILARIVDVARTAHGAA
jgi:dTMP kinase